MYVCKMHCRGLQNKSPWQSGGFVDVRMMWCFIVLKYIMFFLIFLSAKLVKQKFLRNVLRFPNIPWIPLLPASNATLPFHFPGGFPATATAGHWTYCLLALQSSCWWLCYHTCIDNLLLSHLQATSAKPAWLLCHDYCPSNTHTQTHILLLFFLVMIALSRSPFQTWIHKRATADEIHIKTCRPLGSRGITQVKWRGAVGNEGYQSLRLIMCH